MSTTIKKCTNCGADNDIFLSNCLYCKTPLPQADLDSISNEDLIMNAGEWVGKVGDDFQHMTEKHNAWTGKGMISISANQIEGLARKYLALLQARSLNNQNLLVVYQGLKNEFDKKTGNFFYKIGGGSTKKGAALIILFALFLLYIIGLFFG